MYFSVVTLFIVHEYFKLYFWKGLASNLIFNIKTFFNSDFYSHFKHLNLSWLEKSCNLQPTLAIIYNLLNISVGNISSVIRILFCFKCPLIDSVFCHCRAPADEMRRAAAAQQQQTPSNPKNFFSSSSTDTASIANNVSPIGKTNPPAKSPFDSNVWKLPEHV